MPTTGQSLFDALCDDPRDDLLRLVYADWLEEQGDPAALTRAEFIRVQVRLDRLPPGDPLRPALARRERLLRNDPVPDRHPRAAELRRKTRPGMYHELWRAEVPAAEICRRFRFRRGFLDDVEVAAADWLCRGPELCRQTPLTELHLLDAAEVLADVARSPALAGLALLRLSGGFYAGGVCPEAPRLLAASPHLRRLSSLGLTAQAVTDDGVRALATSPNLTGLAYLHLGSNLVTNRGVQLLAAAPAAARLRGLHLGNNYGITDDGVITLAAAPNLADLRALDLSYTPIGEAAALALARSPYLNRLLLLDLAGTGAGGPRGGRELRERFGSAVRLHA